MQSEIVEITRDMANRLLLQNEAPQAVVAVDVEGVVAGLVVAVVDGEDSRQEAVEVLAAGVVADLAVDAVEDLVEAVGEEGLAEVVVEDGEAASTAHKCKSPRVPSIAKRTARSWAQSLDFCGNHLHPLASALLHWYRLPFHIAQFPSFHSNSLYYSPHKNRGGAPVRVLLRTLCSSGPCPTAPPSQSLLVPHPRVARRRTGTGRWRGMSRRSQHAARGGWKGYRVFQKEQCGGSPLCVCAIAVEYRPETRFVGPTPRQSFPFLHCMSR